MRSELDLEARARDLRNALARGPFRADTQHASIMDALRAVALEAGDAVQAAHRSGRPGGTITRPHDCANCYGHGEDGDDDVCGPPRCRVCGGDGVADAAIVLGIERPR
jgi:hypothetical protein